mmetsp:Transcript_36500/g.122224  ORF Transcript_36500/g.122224 Transcript_36500/m.122224 type:complete len:216 (-) Transcript_36500:176-823(-)
MSSHPHAASRLKVPEAWPTAGTAVPLHCLSQHSPPDGSASTAVDARPAPLAAKVKKWQYLVARQSAQQSAGEAAGVTLIEAASKRTPCEMEQAPRPLPIAAAETYSAASPLATGRAAAASRGRRSNSDASTVAVASSRPSPTVWVSASSTVSGRRANRAARSSTPYEMPRSASPDSASITPTSVRPVTIRTRLPRSDSGDRATERTSNGGRGAKE